MSCHPGVTEWTTVSDALPHLSKPQATVLALWSLGMVLARSCALTAVSALLARGWAAKRRPCASSCANAAMKRRLNAGRHAVLSAWRPAFCPCWPGW